jgi:alkanesulfonate monooxygenase SsuD/methylene tetrahydromethanopterin reductase-like flavin-dependent oxidoreductase (luciferase family)
VYQSGTAQRKAVGAEECAVTVFSASGTSKPGEIPMTTVLRAAAILVPLFALTACHQAGPAERAGRSLDNFELIGGGFIASGPDETAVAAQREAARRRLAFYGSTRAYRPVLEHHGWAELSSDLGRLVARERWDDLPGLVSDEVLDTFCLAGTYDLIAQRIEARLGGLVDWVSLPFDEARGDHDRLGRALEEIRQIPAAGGPRSGH